MVTLDIATDCFDNAPSDTTAATLLSVAAQYHRDEMILPGTFQLIVERVAEWLADEQGA